MEVPLNNPQVNPSFKSLIPPLTEQEYSQLEANLLADGCRDPLVVWGGVLVDGHNRLEICEKHGIRYEVVEHHFDDEQQARIWILDNQQGRRNLTDGWKWELAQEKKRLLEELGRAKMSEGGKGLSVIDKPSEPHDTRTEIAAELGWSTGKTAQADYVWNHGDDDIKERVKTGDETVNSAYLKVTKAEKEKEREKRREELVLIGSSLEPADRWRAEHGDIHTYQTSSLYDFIITDPPYPREYLPLYGILAARAKDFIKPGGLVIAMCGQSYLTEIMSLMDEHLEYYWAGCYLTPGQPTSLRQRMVNTSWKPLLIYSLGGYTGKTFGDVFTSQKPDKDEHNWQQSVTGMYDIVKMFCLTGQSIFDPFCGAGSTGVAAKMHGCRFLGIDIDDSAIAISKARLNDAA